MGNPALDALFGITTGPQDGIQRATQPGGLFGGPKTVPQVGAYTGLDPLGRNLSAGMAQSGPRGVPSASSMGPAAPGSWQGSMPWANQSYGPAPQQGGGYPPMMRSQGGPGAGGQWAPAQPGQSVNKDIFGPQPGIFGPPPTPAKLPDFGVSHSGGLDSGPGSQGPTVQQYSGGQVSPISQYAVHQGLTPVGSGGGPLTVNSTFGDWLGGYGQTREQQIGAANMLRDAAMGSAPSVAELQLRQGQEANLRQSMAMANSGRGNATAALMGAQNAGMVGGQQLNQQQAALRAGEMAQARGMYNQALSGIAGQDIGVAQAGAGYDMTGQTANQGAGLSYAGLGLQSRGLDDANTRFGLGALAGYDELAANNYFRPAEINAGIASGNADRKNQFNGGIISAGGSLLGLGV